MQEVTIYLLPHRGCGGAVWGLGGEFGVNAALFARIVQEEGGIVAAVIAAFEEATAAIDLAVFARAGAEERAALGAQHGGFAVALFDGDERVTVHARRDFGGLVTFGHKILRMHE